MHLEKFPVLQKHSLHWRYPAIEARFTGMLDVGDGHKVYYEESGNPKGKPVIFVHGGPGGTCEPRHRQFFNPELYRIIMFDQRGCGKSTPHGSLEANTTWHLIADMEKIREQLKISTWVVFGGSWGSTLALAYAVTHPERVQALILRGIFLGTKAEVDWFYQGSTGTLFPEAYEKLVNLIPPAERSDMVGAYYKRLTSSDPQVRKAAGKAWSIWEGVTSSLYTDLDAAAASKFAEDEFADAFARLETHYFVNNCFFKTSNFLIEQCVKIQHIPTVIVQGRYDALCPMKYAWGLHKALPQSDLYIITDAGHSAFENGISRALVAATDRLALVGA